MKRNKKIIENQFLALNFLVLNTFFSKITRTDENSSLRTNYTQLVIMLILDELFLKNHFSIVFFIYSINSVFCQTTFIGKIKGIKDSDMVVVLDSLNHQTILRLAESRLY
jgi:hypothetical protein